MIAHPPAPAPRMPVVLQVHRRLERLPLTIRALAGQRGAAAELFIWNNSERSDAAIRRLTAGAPFPVHVTGVGRNLPGTGMFRLARDAGGGAGPVVLIDDDVLPAPDALATWRREYEPAGLASFWAFRLRSLTDYYDRVRARPGTTAHYCGTAGMIADGGLFTDPLTFACPERYSLICDLWLSYVASRAGLRLFASAARVAMAPADGRDLFRRVRATKSAFLRYLVANGWDLSVAGRAPRPAQW